MRKILYLAILIGLVPFLQNCGGGGGGGSSTPPPTTNTTPPAAQSSSGSMGIATFKDPNTGNKVTKAYIPAGTTISVVTLSSVAPKPELAAPSFAPTVQSITVANSMDACALDATTLKGVCISITSAIFPSAKRGTRRDDSQRSLHQLHRFKHHCSRYRRQRHLADDQHQCADFGQLQRRQLHRLRGFDRLSTGKGGSYGSDGLYGL